MRDSFVFYESFHKATSELDAETYKKVMTAIFEYAFTGEEPCECDGVVFMAFQLVKPQIDSNNRKYENGKKGGRPKTTQEPEDNQNAENKNQDETKAKPNNNQTETKTEKSKPNVNVNVNDNDNVNVNKIIISRIISYLNQKANTKYRENAKDTISHIKARLADGYTEQDFYKVIDRKCSEWLGTDMQQYLRPSTLFAPSKFESYLNAPDLKAEKRQNTDNQIYKYDIRLSEINVKVSALRGDYERTTDKRERFEIHRQIAELQDEADRIKKAVKRLKGEV